MNLPRLRRYNSDSGFACRYLVIVAAGPEGPACGFLAIVALTGGWAAFRIADGLRPSRSTVASAWLMASSFG